MISEKHIYELVKIFLLKIAGLVDIYFLELKTHLLKIKIYLGLIQAYVSFLLAL